MKTNALGLGTVNRTANLPEGLDQALGKWCFEHHAKSRSDVIRRLLRGLVSGAIKSSQLGLLFVVSAGLGSLGASLLMPDRGDLVRGRGAVRVVRRVSARRGREGDWA